jgi:proteic killer suppression protein
VIKPIKDEETEKMFRRQFSRRLPVEIQQVAYRKLRMINNAHELCDLQIPPANRLEKLKGDRKGQYSIRINQRWRICFDWDKRDAHEVEIVGYH